jgi:multidrug efflux pump subunit AcrA (membrane-fusion protein)
VQRVSATLTFDEFPKRVFKGSVVRFATSLDLATRTMLTEIDLDNPGRVLYPRSYAHVTLDLVRHPDALSIPSAAVQGDGDSAHVLVAKEGRLAEVPISTGINDGGRIEVKSGLTNDSLVVGTYSNALSPGEKVRYSLSNLPRETSSQAGSMG